LFNLSFEMSSCSEIKGSFLFDCIFLWRYFIYIFSQCIKSRKSWADIDRKRLRIQGPGSLWCWFWPVVCVTSGKNTGEVEEIGPRGVCGMDGKNQNSNAQNAREQSFRVKRWAVLLLLLLSQLYFLPSSWACYLQ